MIPSTTEILLFQVGPHVFAASVHDAARIGNVREVPAGDLVIGSSLGMPFARERGIAVAADGQAGRMLVVDAVLGVRSVLEEDLLPLPAFAAACLHSGAVAGLVQVDGAPLLLIDLLTLVGERPGATPTQRAA